MISIIRRVWRVLPLAIRAKIASCFEWGYTAFLNTFDTWMDRQYGVDTSLVRTYSDEERNNTQGKDAVQNVPMHYVRALALRRALKLTADDVLVDLGCGTGRILFTFAQSPIRRIHGIDFDKTACALAERNRRLFTGARDKITIEMIDCAHFRFKDETIVYLYNPFGAETLRSTLANLRSSLDASPRRVRVCYFMHPHRSVIDATVWLKLIDEVSFFKKSFLIYENVRN